MRVRSEPVETIPKLDLSRCTFITGEALAELRKMKSQSVSVIVTSPPYWPAKRDYGGLGIGFEPTLEEYIVALVAIFSEARRVMKDDGVIWIVIDDSYSEGNLQFIPTRLAMALQDDGWICRAEIVWDKGARGVRSR